MLQFHSVLAVFLSHPKLWAIPDKTKEPTYKT